MYLIAFAGLFLLWFMGSVWNILRRAEGGSAGLSVVAVSSGVLLAAMLFAAGATAVSMPASIELGEEAQVGADIGRLGWAAGFFLLVYAMFAGIGFIGAVSALILRTGFLPRWLAWTGIVACIALLFGIFYIPMLVLPLWTIALSVVLFRHESAAQTPATMMPETGAV